MPFFIGPFSNFLNGKKQANIFFILINLLLIKMALHHLKTKILYLKIYCNKDAF